jgi:DNA segregation ATPase FtsK/SpoIIIE-like protein
MQKELEKRRATRTPIQARTVSGESEIEVPVLPMAFKTGIERMSEPARDFPETPAVPPPVQAAEPEEVTAAPEVTERADGAKKARTTLPKISGTYKMPSSSLLQRPDEQQTIDPEELKLLAQVLTDKYSEFEVHGQVTGSRDQVHAHYEPYRRSVSRPQGGKHSD